MQLLLFFLAVGRFDIMSEDYIPSIAPSEEVYVETIVECSLKCAVRKSYSFALVPDGPTSQRCLLYDVYEIPTDLQHSAGSVYMAALMYVTLTDSRDLPPG